MADTNINLDVTGYDELTEAIKTLLNQFPLIGTDEIKFSTLDKDGGVAFYPASGGIIESSKTDITGFVEQRCQYPFTVVYRAALQTAKHRQNGKEWLDTLGCWLEQQPIKTGESTAQLEAYPELTCGRKFTSIERITPAYLSEVEENGAENWVIGIKARYKNEFYR